MLLWAGVFFFTAFGLRLVLSDLGLVDSLSLHHREKLALRQVIALLQELQETLEAGLVPSAARWAALRGLKEPWASLTGDSIEELRACGANLLPTLKRLRSLAQEHEAALQEAKARTVQAFGQALACGALVPVFGAVLYFLLPGVEQHLREWLIAVGIGLSASGGAMIWLMRMAEQARWGGLDSGRRSWVLDSHCAGERFLALVRSGVPSDLAWVRALRAMAEHSGELVEIWGRSVWQEPSGKLREHLPAVARSLRNCGSAIRKSVQAALNEGRPCTERVEGILSALREEVRSQMIRELSLLGTRALKPLFLLVAPALLGLLGFGIFLAWRQGLGEFYGPF